ncbi:MAG: hypothetical protein DMF62_11485 [Acidobacteria bacterium]|nr:MAG: hypothetical protein DMF62_11485 [Acidobacteriota bacterium]
MDRFSTTTLTIFITCIENEHQKMRKIRSFFGKTPSLRVLNDVPFFGTALALERAIGRLRFK